MNDLTLEELRRIRDWYYFFIHESPSSYFDQDIFSKIQHEISEREFEDNKLPF